jgi:Flp pilus assembly protein TadD
MTRNCILNFLGLHHLLAGELATAERLIDEDRLIADATGNLPVTYAAMLLTAWQGRVHEASELIQAAVRMRPEVVGAAGRLLGVRERDARQRSGPE